MNRRRVGCLVGAGVALLLILAFAWRFLFSESAAIGSCLDSGGRWADGGHCEGAQVGE